MVTSFLILLLGANFAPGLFIRRLQMIRNLTSALVTSYSSSVLNIMYTCLMPKDFIPKAIDTRLFIILLVYFSYYKCYGSIHDVSVGQYYLCDKS